MEDTNVVVVGFVVAGLVLVMVSDFTLAVDCMSLEVADVAFSLIVVVDSVVVDVVVDAVAGVDRMV